jgi:hypothetical protein
LLLLSSLILLACEKTPLEQAGIHVDENSPKAQQVLVQMIPGEPKAYAEENIQHGNLRLLAFHDVVAGKRGIKIPAVAERQLEDYAVSFGVMMVPNIASSGNEQAAKLQQYFLQYAKTYNQVIIRHRLANMR